MEYCEQCRQNSKLLYKSTQFNKNYTDYVDKTKATIYLEHKRGETMQVGCAGQTVALVDTVTGEQLESYRFVTRILTLDNLKTGILKNSRTETVLNKSYQGMAEYYGAAILPAWPRSPKDKTFVEGSVVMVSTWILVALCNRCFLFHMKLNQTIRAKLDTL